MLNGVRVQNFNQLGQLRITRPTVLSAVVAKALVLGACEDRAAHGRTKQRAEVWQDIDISIYRSRLSPHALAFQREANLLMKTLGFRASHRQQMRQVLLAVVTAAFERLRGHDAEVQQHKLRLP